MSLLYALLTLSAMAFSPELSADVQPPAPATEELLRIAKTQIASQMGSDRHGNLWVWKNRSGLLQVFSPQAVPLRTLRLAEIARVDVDGEWGVVGLSWTGDRLVFLDFRDGAPSDFLLSEPATDVAWVGAGKVALGMHTGASPIQIYDLKEGRAVDQFGSTFDELKAEETGLYRQRNFLIKWDARNRRLWCLIQCTQVCSSSPPRS